MVKFPFSQVGKSSKLAPIYRGPYKIIDKINNLNYKTKLILNNKIIESIVHLRRIKSYYCREDYTAVKHKNEIISN